MKFHKNLHLVALLATMIALDAQAAPVSSVQACRAVSAWAAANGSAFANPGYAVSAKPEFDADGVTKLYYKVQMSNGGLVIASPDTDLDLVVAVLENSDGNFPKGHPLPSILKADMRNRLSVLAGAASRASSLSASSQSASSAIGLPADVKESIRKSNALWEKYDSASAMRLLSGEEDDVKPVTTNVLRVVKGFEEGGVFTHWDQEDVGNELCYNYHTPENEVCGCVATAGAAIMQFFGNGTNIGKTGPASDVECTLWGLPIDAETIPGAIDWNILPKSHGGTSDGALDEAARELLGRVTYNLGVLVGMGWASDGPDTESGAYVSSLVDAFKKYGFHTARAVDFNEDAVGTSQYFKMIYAQNWAGIPVVLGIHGTSGGHAVVACGYAKTSDDEDLCRVFMGWGGDGDAWYKFPTVKSYSIVSEAVTMIGYDCSSSMDPAELATLDEDAANDIFNKYGTVPVCGWANVTDTKLLFPGVTKSAEGDGGSISFTLSASVDSNGFFAVRIPADTTDLRIVHADSGSEMLISPFSSSVLKDESKSRDDLEKAMPSELAFLIFNMVVKSTVGYAWEQAREEGKALLMVSGAGSLRESMLLDYITHCDGTTDMSNKFVFVRVNSSDVYGDGDPSIGVFDPDAFVPAGRWDESNGCLAYENFLDRDADLMESLKYTFSEGDTEALTNSVNTVLNSGYDLYARRHSGISMTVKAVDAEGNELDGIGDVDIGYGVYTNCWLDGQIVSMSAPLECTNEVDGIVYKCVGWSTNESAAIVSAIATNEVSLALFTNATRNVNIAFLWVWQVKAYRVTSSPSDLVFPAVAWVYPGDRVTLVAAKTTSSEHERLYAWNVTDCMTSGADINASVEPCQNGTAFSFTVPGPVEVLAKYKKGKPLLDDPESYSVSLSFDPPELAEFMEENLSLGVGSNLTYDTTISLAPYMSSIVDSTGGVWKCVGYVEDGETNSISDVEHISFEGSSSASLQLVWELQEPEEEPVPEPGPISLTSLSRSSDGEWSIAVEGAVKGCWYTLYAADDISKLAGPSDSWTADEVESKQATDDGESIVFKMTPTANAQFWRVKASGTKE